MDAWVEEKVEHDFRSVEHRAQLLDRYRVVCFWLVVTKHTVFSNKCVLRIFNVMKWRIFYHVRSIVEHRYAYLACVFPLQKNGNS